MTLWNRIRGRRGLGCLPYVADKHDYNFDGLALPSIGLPVTVSMRSRSKVLDQGPTESCVPHSTAAALRIAWGQLGIEFDPSVLFLGFNARASHNDQFRDVGTTPRACIHELSHFGAAPDEVWPFVVANLKKTPPWRAYRKAFDHKGPEAYYRIFEFGSARVDAVRAAIAAYHPVIFGTEVAESLFAVDGPQVVDRPSANDPIAGRHAMCIIGYDAAGNFEVQQSWGPYWRDHGYFWITESYLRASYTDDLQVFKLAAMPQLREAA